MRQPLFLLTALGSVLLAGLALAAPRAPQQAPAATTATPSTITWTDLSGKRYGGDEIARAKATVFLFSGTHCPIAAKYALRMGQLAKEYSNKQVAFFVINSNADESTAEWASYVKERGFPCPAVKDDGAVLAQRLGATTTPEAVVVDSAGVVRYIGRIDDNVNREKVTRPDLRNAIESVLAGQPVKYPRVRASGCEIFREPATVAAATGPVTYSRDIAPILNANCVACHRTGDVGPFPLTNYAEAKPWARAIKQYTTRRLMPPWKAVPGHGEFLDARWLSDSDLSKLARWADSGAPEGSRKDLPPAPKLYEPNGWALGTPDLVVKPVRPYHLDAEGSDVYRNFTLPIDFERDRYIAAFDFRPSNRAVVHHIIAYIDVDGSTAAEKDNRETEPGWSVSGGVSGIRNEAWGSGWAPGMSPRRYADGMAIKVPKGAKLVLQVHYHKSGKPEVDQSETAIYWAKEPVRQVVHVSPIANPFFALKPNIAGQEVRAGVNLPVDITLHGILPHMHMLGKTMKVWAELPDGSQKSLILIQNWDFNWQMSYAYREPVKLPKGTKLRMVATYDNTVQNPNQPSNPPKLVRFGEQTTDEMCITFLMYTVDGRQEGGF